MAVIENEAGPCSFICNQQAKRKCIPKIADTARIRKYQCPENFVIIFPRSPASCAAACCENQHIIRLCKIQNLLV